MTFDLTDLVEFDVLFLYYFCSTFCLYYITMCVLLFCVYLSVCVLSFTPFFSMLVALRFPPVISSSSKENGSFFCLFFYCDMVACCQGTVSRSSSPSQSRRNMVRSADIFSEFYPFSCEIFFGLLARVCGKQCEIRTEKNSVTDAGCA